MDAGYTCRLDRTRSAEIMVLERPQRVSSPAYGAVMKPKLNIAIIGYGFMGKAHSNAYQKVGRFIAR